MNKQSKIGILASIIAVAVISSAFASQNYIQESSTDDLAISNGPVPTPPPLELSQVGQKVASFADAKMLAQIDRAVKPTNIPGNLVLSEVRVADAEGGDEITLIYKSPNLPQLKEHETPTIERHIKDGMIITIKSYPDDFSWWNDHVDQQVQEAPQVRSSTIINGQKAMLMQDTPEYGWPYEAKIITDNKLIHVVSSNYDTVQLEKVLRSMIG